jgi:hypothetical protein
MAFHHDHFLWFALFAVSVFCYRATNQVTALTANLEIWKNCPMPPTGWWLIVESEWQGKQPNEQFRCSLARRRPPGQLSSS